MSENKQSQSVTPRVRNQVAGCLLLLMIVAYVGADITAVYGRSLTLVAGISAWVAAALLIVEIRNTQKILTGILILSGLVLMLWVWSKSGSLAVTDALTRNAGLLTMIISVGFLKLIALPMIDEDRLGADRRLPRGKTAFRDTLLSVAIFGSFINISAPVLIADRLSQRRPLDLFTSACVTRIFSGCSAWSPFFGGMAVVLTYVNGVAVMAIMLGGLPFAVAGFLLVYIAGTTRHKQRVETFRGFPMQVSSLWVPAMLAVLVVAMARFAPQLSMLTVIALGALLITLLTLLMRQGVLTAASQLTDFVVNGLPKSGNELLLFLAAGVLATGLTGIVDLGLVTLPPLTLDGYTASLLLIVMVMIAMVGIHPVIQVAAFTPLLASVSPDPELLAITYLFAWSLGTCASPLSGTHLVMQGRYGIPSWKGAINNWPFVFPMLLVAIVILHFVAKVNGL